MLIDMTSTHGSADLPVRRSPVAAPVSGNGLFEMATRRGEVITVEQRL